MTSAARKLKGEVWVPRPYQRTAVKWLVQHAEAALLLDPGLGKTTVTLAAFKLMQRAGGVRKALVIAPKRVCYNVWTQEEGGELSKWRDFNHLKVVLLHGPEKDEAVTEDADIYVINPDGLEWLINNGHLKSLWKRGVDCLVIDELSKFKHVQTKRFKRLKPHLGRFRRRWGLTGSPAANGLLDLFGQMYVLDLGRALGAYVTHYRNKYFNPTGFGGYTWVPQEGASEKIYQAVGKLALSMKAEDHLDLPPLVEQNIFINLPKEARRIYDQLEDVLVTQIEQELVTAANAAVASGKCRQVASGGLYADLDEKGKRPVHHVHDEKTEALEDLVGELNGSPLLIAYEFDHDLQRIRKALGKDLPAINGKTPDGETRELIVAWNKGELPLLAGHPAAMGHGLNLQGFGNHVCWYTLTWDFELYDQLIRRVWRQGQKQRVIVHRILARDTVDEDVARVISSKRRTQDSLFRALRDLKRRRR